MDMKKFMPFILAAFILTACQEKSPTSGISLNCVSEEEFTYDNFPAEGGRLTFEVITRHAEVSYSSNRDWCSYESSTDEDGSRMVTVIVERNTATEDRSAVFTVYGETGSTLEQLALTIGQSRSDKADAASDLSAEGAANCYVINSAGTYLLDATVMGNGVPAGSFVPETISPADAVLVWQSEAGMITSVELLGGDLVFEASGAEGNALVAVTDEEGGILWSWHIWNPGMTLSALQSSDGYGVMNVNLGALAVDFTADARYYGLLYQWGRKDPFPGSPTLTGTTSTMPVPVYDMDGAVVETGHSSYTSLDENNIEYAISHPTVVISNQGQYLVSRDWLKSGSGNDGLWGDASAKTCFDPCPPGWRVPDSEVFRHFTSSGSYAWNFYDFNVEDVNGDGVIDIDDYDYGWRFWLDRSAGVSSFFPAAARYDGSYAMLMGSVSGIWGSYWSSTPDTESAMGIEGMAHASISFSTKNMDGTDMLTVAPGGSASRADAYSVRCVRE